MERYLGGEPIDEAVLIADLSKAVAHGSFFPVIPVCSGTGVGTVELLEVAARGFRPRPSMRCRRSTTPWRRPRRPGLRPGGPLLAEVVKTTSDPYVGRVSLVRCSPEPCGPTPQCMCPGRFQLNSSRRTPADHDEDERVGTLSFRWASSSVPAQQVIAGTSCAIGRLSRAETGDTLSDKADPLLLKPWTMPTPLLPVAIQARAKTDGTNFRWACNGWPPDPTLRIEQNPETHQIVLWCMGGRTPVWCSTRWRTGTG